MTAQSENPMVDQRQVRLILAYIGHGFHGWQSQPDGSGIQDHLEKALATVMRRPIRVTSASRTDTGVHAEFQVVTFRVIEEVDLFRLTKSLNALLPLTVRVRDAAMVAMEFHPILSSVAKVYRYQLWRAHGEHPFIMPYVWKWSQHMDVAAMQAAAACFVGEHDFTSFCAVDSSAKTKTRRVIEVRLVEKGPLLELWFVGEGFLKQMVRTMVGAIVSVGLGKHQVSDISAMLAAKDRRAAPATAPAEGLCLVRVYYDDEPDLEALLQSCQKGYNLSVSGEWYGIT